ncbi:MAG: sigma-70 family RNA polymerase sigma factor [Firmicutes bacterium]|nr:sigma-70 family RNA polymerase sigma factor [Bacillota bacterium]
MAGRASAKQLIERCLTGDVRAFETLVRDHQSQVYAYACRMVGREAAEDVTQEVFLRVYRRLHTYRQEADFRTWLLRIAYNACIDHLRQWRRRREQLVSLDGGEAPMDAAALPAEGPQASDPHARAERREFAQVLQQALLQLTEKHRAVIVLHDMHGLSYEEVGKVLGCSLGTVKSRLFYARRALREQLRPYVAGAGDNEGGQPVAPPAS